MGKQEELEELDTNMRRMMLEATRPEGDTSVLKDLTVVGNYLAKNQVLAEKAKGTLEEEVEDRLAKAKKRRSEV